MRLRVHPVVGRCNKTTEAVSAQRQPVHLSSDARSWRISFVYWKRVVLVATRPCWPLSDRARTGRIRPAARRSRTSSDNIRRLLQRIQRQQLQSMPAHAAGQARSTTIVISEMTTSWNWWISGRVSISRLPSSLLRRVLIWPPHSDLRPTSKNREYRIVSFTFYVCLHSSAVGIK